MAECSSACCYLTKKKLGKKDALRQVASSFTLLQQGDQASGPSSLFLVHFQRHRGKLLFYHMWSPEIQGLIVACPQGAGARGLDVFPEAAPEGPGQPEVAAAAGPARGDGAP